MNWTLLHKYLTEECDPEEMQQVEAWLRADERNQRFFDTLLQIWEIQPIDEVEVDAKRAWENFQKKIPDADTGTGRPPTETPIFNITKGQQESGSLRKRYRRTMAMALSAAAVLLIAFLFYQYTPQISLDNPVAEAPKPRQIVTERGQRTTMQLVDGTRIQLNANSKIEIPADYNDSTRTIQLEGEGFFEVVHDPSRPFVVKSGGVYTQVLGTKFGVRAYTYEQSIQVVVEEGKVAMGLDEKKEKKRQQIFVEKNQKATFSQIGISKATGLDDLEPYLGWRNGKLIFNDLPLEEVVPRLERWYDVEVRLEDSSIKDLRFNARFQDESLTEVLNVLALSLDLNYNRNGRTIVFSSNRG